MGIHQVSAAEFAASEQSGPAATLGRIVADCNAHDGVATLNDQARLELKHRGLHHASLWLFDEVGFALLHSEHLDLAVAPQARGNGIGTALATAAVGGLDRVEAWSHADHPAAARLAARFRVGRERELKIMSRPTSVPVHAPEVPEGVGLRTFGPSDAAAVVALNALAFAHHAEQGDLTLADFTERTLEPWFDPQGLILAVDTTSGDLLGFHWTKVHRDEVPAYGEVYVVAVDPAQGGRGLGTALTRAGLLHLAHQEVDEVILYVDGDNNAALAVYRKQGFEEVRTEVQYRGRPTLP